MSNSISAVGIPHILDEIASHLDRRDFASCVLVSRDFYEIFRPHIWRRLVFQNTVPSDAQDIAPSQERALQNNVHWTRNLFVDTSCHQDALRVLCSTCKGLTEIKLHMTRSGDWDEASLSQILPFVSSNKGLQTCAIRSYSDFTRDAIVQLTKALSVSHITDLNLMLVTRPRLGWLENILQKLPLTLKHLFLQRGRVRADDIDYIPTDGWPQSYPYLEDVTMVIKVTPFEEIAFLQFLERCPSLKTFSVPQMTITETISNLTLLLKDPNHLPNLEALEMCYIHEMSEGQWWNLVSGMQNRIKKFAFSIPVNTPSTIMYIDLMATSWASNLESLKIMEQDRITSEDIQRILTTCVKLKQFDCLCPWLLLTPNALSRGSERLPGLKTIMTEGNEYDMPDWVCLDLEELKITFADPRDPEAEEPVASQQAVQTARGIKRVYEQIGRLKKLKELTVGWCPFTKFSKNVNLDMSLQSGLEVMGRMESLRMVDVSFIPNINIGSAEVSWMMKNWPSLKQFVGLRYRYRRMGPDEPVPEYITLMSSEREWLDIS